jgi:hypothetical protein
VNGRRSVISTISPFLVESSVPAVMAVVPSVMIAKQVATEFKRNIDVFSYDVLSTPRFIASGLAWP